MPSSRNVAKVGAVSSLCTDTERERFMSRSCWQCREFLAKPPSSAILHHAADFHSLSTLLLLMPVSPTEELNANQCCCFNVCMYSTLFFPQKTGTLHRKGL
ncbi:unnamed protein product [Scytosiphon promiscuus]